MKQRIFAILLALALLVTVGVLSVSAEETTTVKCPVHENCTAKWQPWTLEAGMDLAESGHYYLTGDLTIEEQYGIQAGGGDPLDVVLDLRGFDITSSDRVFVVRAYSTFSLMDSVGDGIVTGAKTSDGGTIYLNNGIAEDYVTFNLYSGTVSSGKTNYADEGGTIYAASYAEINIHGGTIIGGYAKDGGAVHMLENGTFTMTDGTIKDGKAHRGGNIALMKNSITANISGGTISGGASTESSAKESYGGGNIYMLGAKVTISDNAVVEGGSNTASTGDANRGGGNIAMNGGTLTINGGIIRNGSTNASGGNILARGTVNISGGQIYGGTTSASATSATVGGNNIGFRTNQGVLNISGGSITDGDIAIIRNDAQTSRITLSGKPQIEEINFKTTFAYTITLGALTEGAKIGITHVLGTGFTVANEKAADYAQYFYGATVRAKAVADTTANTLSMAANNYCSVCTADQTWTAWSGGNIAEDGHYYLTKNVTGTSMVRVGYDSDASAGVKIDVCIDMLGHSITKASTVNDSKNGAKAVTVYAVSTVDLFNSGVESVISGNSKTQGGSVVLSGTGTTLNLYDNIRISHADTGYAVTYGGTIDVSAGILNMHGGIIEGFEANWGGALYINKGQFNMSAGIVRGGSAAQGGNIYVAAGSTVNISGGTISGGTASSYGGNIRIADSSSAKVTIANATVELGNCTKDSDTSASFGGGNIFNQGVLTINEGAIIRDGSSKAAGGNIHNRRSLTINGGTITNENGITAGAGHNIFSYNSSAVNVINGGVITDGDIATRSTTWKSFTLSGAPQIENLDLTLNDAVITLGDLTSGADITVTANPSVVFTTETANAQSYIDEKYIKSGVEDLDVCVNNNCLVLNKLAVCAHCKGEAVAWIDLSTVEVVTVADSYKGFPGGHYYLSEDYDATARMVVNANTTYGSDKLCIDLNGHTYEQTNKDTQAFWVRSDSGDLAIMDLSAEKTGKVTGSYSAHNSKGDATGTIIYMTHGQFSLYSGTLEYTGTGIDLGGVIGSRSGDVIINIKGGTVTGGKAENGGSIYASSGGAQINISGNAVITGGQAVNEDAIPRGGNIFCGGTFTMTGGKISDGTATATAVIPRGGNVYLNSNNAHSITGGTITGGVANNGNGGNVYIYQGSLTVSNATISNGTATRPLSLSNGGGNIYAYDNTVLDIQSGTITGGATASLGGNVMVRGTATIASRSILSEGESTSAIGVGQELFGSGATLTVTDLGEDWNGDIVLTNDATITNNTVGVATAIYHEGRAFDVWYASIDNAKAADTDAENTYLALSLDGKYDLNGHIVDIRGHVATVNGAAAWFDASNDDYEGYGVAILDTVPLASYTAPNGNLYITVREGEKQYSFHRLNMSIEAVTLRSSVGGVYYSAVWNADDVLAGSATSDPVVLGYGIALTKGDVELKDFVTQGAYTYFDNVEGLTNNFLYNVRGKEINSCVLKNIVKTTNDHAQNTTNAQTYINAAPFIYFVAYDGSIQTLFGTEWNTTFENAVKAAVDMANNPELTEEKVAKLKNNLAKVYDTWYTDAVSETDYRMNQSLVPGLKDIADEITASADSTEPTESTDPTGAES